MLTFGNKKMKKTAAKNNITLAAFTRPAGITCAKAGICMRWCYAQTGPFLFPGPKKHALRNLEISTTKQFTELMNAELTILKAKGKPVWVRIHDAGDFNNDEAYAKQWLSIMGSNPTVSFYAYTKEHVLLRSLGFDKVPNFTMLCSEGGQDDDKIVGARVRVVPEDTKELPDGYEFGDVDDDLHSVRVAMQGKNIALVAHGARKRSVRG